MQRRIRKIGDQLGPIEDGDVLRVGMADSKNPMQKILNDYVDHATRMVIGDGTGDPFALNRQVTELTTTLECAPASPRNVNLIAPMP